MFIRLFYLSIYLSPLQVPNRDDKDVSSPSSAAERSRKHTSHTAPLDEAAVRFGAKFESQVILSLPVVFLVALLLDSFPSILPVDDCLPFPPVYFTVSTIREGTEKEEGQQLYQSELVHSLNPAWKPIEVGENMFHTHTNAPRDAVSFLQGVLSYSSSLPLLFRVFEKSSIAAPTAAVPSDDPSSIFTSTPTPPSPVPNSVPTSSPPPPPPPPATDRCIIDVRIDLSCLGYVEDFRQANFPPNSIAFEFDDGWYAPAHILGLMGRGPFTNGPTGPPKISFASTNVSQPSVPASSASMSNIKSAGVCLRLSLSTTVSLPVPVTHYCFSYFPQEGSLSEEVQL
jgi:hypothetical protein